MSTRTFESQSQSSPATAAPSPVRAGKGAPKDPTSTPLWAQTLPVQPHSPAGIAPGTSPMVMREETSSPSAAPKSPEKTDEEVDISFGSAAVPWYLVRPLVLNFPSRWQIFAQKAKDDLNKDDQELLSNMSGSLQNLMYAGIYTQLSSYKPSWSKSLKIAENLSGVSGTYMNLLSFAVMRDLEKYLTDDVGDDIKRNMGWLIIYGALLQGGLVGLNAGLDKDLDFTSLIAPATDQWTAAPTGFGRPFQLKNIPDPRWGSYGFGSSPSGLESTLTGFEDPKKPYAFNLKLGLNIASMADLYPEDEKEKEKYRGFELYPYFSVKHEWAQGDVQPTLKNRWLIGVFLGDEGLYTLIEGGQQTRPDNSVAETYLRNAFLYRGAGRLSQLHFSQELSMRPENSEARARLNAAAKIKLLDRKAWEATVGAGIGVLLPGAGLPGAFDASGELSFHHKYYQSGKKDADPFKSGLSVGSTWRPEDPFNADSSQLFSISSKLSILDTVILSFEHHRVHPGLGPPGAQLDPSLPNSDTRFMLLLGPGIWRWK